MTDAVSDIHFEFEGAGRSSIELTEQHFGRGMSSYDANSSRWK